MVTKKAVIAVLACASFAAIAQSEPARRATDAAAKVPTVEYRSAFSDYRASREEPMASWPRLHLELGPPLWGPGSQAAQPDPGRPATPSAPRVAPVPYPGHGAGHPK